MHKDKWPMRGERTKKHNDKKDKGKFVPFKKGGKR